MKKDKYMERGDVNFQFANNMIAVKWFDNHGVTMVGACLEEFDKISTISRRVKGQNAKYLFNAQRSSKITILVWVVLIFWIKRKQLTN